MKIPAKETMANYLQLQYWNKLLYDSGTISRKEYLMMAEKKRRRYPTVKNRRGYFRVPTSVLLGPAPRAGADASAIRRRDSITSTAGMMIRRQAGLLVRTIIPWSAPLCG